jgi:folate-binding protein YgfZ
MARVSLPPGYLVRPSAVLDVIGDDRAAFLQGQLTSDVRLAVPGSAVPTAGLTPKGKILFVGRLVGLSDRFRLLLPPSLGETVLAHLSKYAVFQRVSVSDRSRDFSRIGLYGELPEAAQSPRLESPSVLRLGPDGEFSRELIVESDFLEEARRILDAAGVRPVNEATALAARVEAGRPEFGVDFDETNLIDEVGLQGAVSTTKGCYVGQEIVARLRTYGRVHRRVTGFRFPDGRIDPGTRLARAGAAPPDRVDPGRITTGADSPRFGSIGLGWASRAVEIGDALVAADGPGAGRRAVVSALPFA